MGLFIHPLPYSVFMHIFEEGRHWDFFVELDLIELD